MNTSTKFSFIEIINDYCITIPHLQRDYVQGKIDNRDKLIPFLEYIYENLKLDKVINLDFIFGYETDIGNELIPIDGQQRLTTVFLIHWFLAKKSDDYQQFKDALIKNGKPYFNYETRINSQDFIYNLISKEISLSDDTISKNLTSSKWFYLPWQQDATIAAMMSTLDCIQDVFKDDSIEDWYRKLLNSKLIQFEFLNPNAIELSDEFYIKMNARGLPLSKFENFKANLLAQIEENLGSQMKTDFARDIDETWSDSIWNWTVKAQVKYDTAIYNILNYSFDLLNAQNHIETPNNYSFPNSISDLVTKENIKYITDIFDFLCKTVSDRNYEDELFSNNVKRLLTNVGFGHFERLLLYAQLSYSLKFELADFEDENYRDFVRIYRHILINTNQSKKTEYVSDLRPSRYSELIQTIHQLITVKNPYQSLISLETNNKILSHEIEKAKIVIKFPEKKEALQSLEDQGYLDGWLVNFMFLFQEKWDPNFAVEKFKEVWRSEDKFLYQALFSIGDYTTHVSWSGLGPVFYAGKANKWNRVLANNNANENPRQIKVFKKLFQYLIIDKIDLKHIALPLEQDYKYYFAKYPEILINDHNLFVYHELSENIELMTRTTLTGSHINYLGKALKLHLSSKPQINLDGFQFYEHLVEWSTIKYNNTEILFFNGKNWLINKREEILFSTSINSKDLVEIASDYIQKKFL